MKLKEIRLNLEVKYLINKYLLDLNFHSLQMVEDEKTLQRGKYNKIDEKK